MIEIKQTSNNYGISQEALVISLLAQYGTVSIPVGNSARYDCLLEYDDMFLRIQIKSLNILSDGERIMIPMCNSNCKKNIKKVYTSEEVDYIAIAYKEVVYLFEPTQATALTVHINKPKYDNQHWIEDYEISKVLNFNFVDWISQKEKNRKDKPQYTCRICGSPVSQEGNLCRACLNRKKAEDSARPEKEVLKAKLMSKVSFVQMGRDFKVSDNAVRKWCKYYGLPFRVKDIKNMTMEDWDKL